MYRFKTYLEAFQAALRSVIDGKIAVADSLIIRSHGERVEGIAERWSVQSELPDPRVQKPFARIAILANRDVSDAWIETISPGQLFIVVVFDALHPDELRISVCEGPRVSKIDEVELIGPGMIHAGSIREIAGSDKARESRLVQIHGDTHSWWRSANLVVVGAGSGGSQLTLQAASHQPKSMILVDPDFVQIHNLNNMPHASTRSAKRRKRKIDDLMRQIHRNNPDIVVHGVPYRVQDSRVRRFCAGRQRVDVVMSFVDNQSATVAAGWLAQEVSAVHVALATLVSRDATTGRIIEQFDVRLFEPRRGCAACVPWQDEERIHELIYDYHRPPQALDRGPRRRWNADGRIGSSLSLNAVAAGFALNLLQRYLDGRVTRSTWVRGLPQNGGLIQVVEEGIQADARCPFCNERQI